MNDELLNSKDLNLELRELLDNLESINHSADLYSIIVEEKLLATV